MRNVAVGSVLALIMVTGLFVSQVEAKNNDNDDGGKNKQVSKFIQKIEKHDWKDIFRFFAKLDKHNDTRSVPIPGTELLLGGGFAGLIAWRARQRQRRG